MAPSRQPAIPCRRRGGGMVKSWLALAVGLVCVPPAWAAGPPSSPAPSISPDEKAVYEAVLTSWLGAEQGPQFVNAELGPPPSPSDAEFTECAKGLDFPPNTPVQQGPKSLVGVQFNRSGIELIDGSRWSPVDPGRGIAEGKTVESAVKDGFAHSLMSFSQIVFNRTGRDAIVKFGMVCGSLCGSGSTLHLHKSGDRWVVLNRCGGWIS